MSIEIHFAMQNDGSYRQIMDPSSVRRIRKLRRTKSGPQVTEATMGEFFARGGICSYAKDGTGKIVGIASYMPVRTLNGTQSRVEVVTVLRHATLDDLNLKLKAALKERVTELHQVQHPIPPFGSI